MSTTQPLAGKTALVTGGSRGIGAATAKLLAAQGARVAVNYAGSKDRADQVVAAIKAAGGDAFAVQADISKPEDVERLFTEIDSHFGGSLDILVNNAGIFELQPLEGASLDHFDRTSGVNVRGVYDVTRTAAKRLRDHGRVITTGSIMSQRGLAPATAVYDMSKAAVVGLTKGWAHDFGPRQITVNVVQPGPIDTEMNPDIPENPFAEAGKAATALKRYGTADEVASTIAYLASPGAGYITGQTITVDGGLDA